MALIASGVKLLDPLKDPLGGIAKQRKTSLQDELGRISGNATASAAASGRPMGEYAPAQLERSGMMGARGIDDTLAGVLGKGSYDENQSQLEYDRNMQLAKAIGSASKPSLLQEILGGLRGGAQAGGQIGGIYQALGRRSPGGSLPPNLSLYEPDSTGYARYR